MGRSVLYTSAPLGDGHHRVPEPPAAGYRIDIFESGVDETIADFRSTGAGGVSCHGGHWVIAGVKATPPEERG